MSKEPTISTETIQRLTVYLAEMQRLTAEEPATDGCDSLVDGNGTQVRFFGGESDHAEWERKVARLTDKYRDDVLEATVYYLKTQKPNAGFSIDDAIHAVIDHENIKKVLPALQSIVPQKHLIPNNKLANHVNDIIGIGQTELVVSKQGKNEITTKCIINYDSDNVKITGRRPFTEYDRNVADAVTSLYEYGDKSHIITPAMVFRAMVHAAEQETPSTQQLEAVVDSLDKMRFLRVQIDCSEELRQRGLSLNGKVITGGKVDTYLLTLKKVEVRAGGHTTTAYKIIDAPVLYDYARMTGQVITVPAKLLDIRDSSGGKISNTETRIAVKGYLMRRISVMKGKTANRQSKIILYNTMFEELGLTDLTRDDQKRIRKYCLEVLEYWKSSGFVNGYSELTQGKKKTGIEIVP